MSSQVKLLAVNLKHFYQRRGCWFYYLVFLFMVVFPVLNILGISLRGGVRLSYDPQKMLGPILFLWFFLNMLTGMLAGDLVRSVAVKPFSVCLPKYKRIPAKIIAIMGLAVNLSFTWLVMAGAQYFFSSILIVFSLGMFIYVSFAIMVLKSLNPSVFFGFFGFMGLYGFIAGTQLMNSVWTFFEANSLWISAVLLAVCWWWLRNLNAVRIAEKLCDVPTLDMFSIWNTDKAKRVAEYRIAKRNDRLGFGIAALLEKLMRSTSARSVKYGIGLAITGCGFTVVNMWSILGLLFIVVIFCYMPVEGNLVKIMLFIMPAFSVMQLSNAGRIPMLVGCGRKERAGGAIIAGLIYTAIMTAGLFLVVSVSLLLDTFMPSFTIIDSSNNADVAVNFEPLKFRYITILFFTMPIMYAISVINIRFGLVVLLVLFQLVIGIFVASKVLNAGYLDILQSSPSLLIPLLILLCVVSCLIIRRHFLKADFRSLR